MVICVYFAEQNTKLVLALQRFSLEKTTEALSVSIGRDDSTEDYRNQFSQQYIAGIGRHHFGLSIIYVHAITMLIYASMQKLTEQAIVHVMKRYHVQCHVYKCI